MLKAMEKTVVPEIDSLILSDMKENSREKET